jgi:hypothetical protein
MANKKRIRRVPKRLNTPFLRSVLDELNTEIEKYHGTSYKKITPADAEACYSEYGGKCVFCDTRLAYLGRPDMAAARLMFYVPLKYNGPPIPTNLVLVCLKCKYDNRSTRKLRTEITGLDSFADCCEQLFIAVRDGYPQSKIDMLKNRINTRLSDVAMCMRYVTTPDWRPVEMTKLIENKNTIADRLEQMGEGDKVTKCITEDVKQIVTTKQYKIMRSQPMREPTDAED